MNHPRRGGFFFYDFASGGCRRRVETKQHKKEPNMANGNTNPGIGESADSGVMHNTQPSRVR
jgi:hypothetical protein